MYMQFALARGEGFLLITGKPGTGKTTLVKELLGQLEMTRYKVSTLVSTQLEADDLIRSIAYLYELNVESSNKATVIQRLYDFFLNRWRNGLHTILVVDEAQDLVEASLEELRLLTNFERDNKPLLQVFLVGQPRLYDILGANSMEQLRQRITVATVMKPMEEHDVEEYIKHRLITAGWVDDPEISPEVYKFIYQYTCGIPRQINVLCTRLLLHGFVEDRHSLEKCDVMEVANELADEHLPMSGNISIPRPEPAIEDLVKHINLNDSKKFH